MRALYVFSFIILGTGACEKEREEPATEASPMIQFGGVTLTDSNGIPLSNPDPDDWRLNVEWNDHEGKLFDGKAKDLCSEGEKAFIAVFPNPASNLFGLTLGNMKDAFQINLRIVDRNYQAIKSYGPINLNEGAIQNLLFNIEDIGITNDTVRLYYRLDFGNCEYRGYGDIIIR